MGTLRFILALAVVAFHAGPIFGGKWMGADAVPAFFIISGFYMALILNGRYADARSFYISRALRLYPVYWVFLAFIVLIYLLPTLPGTFGGNLSHAGRTQIGNAANLTPIGLFNIIPNVLMVGSEWVRQLVYDPETGAISLWRNGVQQGPRVVGFYSGLVIPQNWSVAVELTFYLLAPWLARRQTGTLVVICVASFVGWNLTKTDLAFQHMLPMANFWLFVMGMITFRWAVELKYVRRRSLLALAMIPFVVFYLWERNVSNATAAMFFVAFATGLPALFVLTRNINADRWIGELSYPIYITHLFFQFPTSNLGWWSPYACAAISIVISVLLYKFVQLPVDQYRHRFVANKSA